MNAESLEKAGREVKGMEVLSKKRNGLTTWRSSMECEKDCSRFLGGGW